MSSKKLQASILSVGQYALGYDYEYQKPITHALHNYFMDYIEYIGIKGAIIGGNPGPDTVFAWAADSAGIETHLIVPCLNFGEHWETSEKDRYAGIRKKCKTYTAMGSVSWSADKERIRIQRVVQQSDIIFVVKKGNVKPTVQAYTYNDFMNGIASAQALDKEIIIVNTLDFL